MKIPHIAIPGVLMILLVAAAAAGPQARAPEPDYGSIEGILAALYGSITYGPETPPRIDVMRSLYLPEARLVRLTKDGPNRMSLDEFVSFFTDRIQKGTVRTFVEEEIARRTETFGSIAQVFSTYRKGADTTDRAAFVRGINSLLLVNDGRRWWIVSIIWQDESPEHPIPEKYLQKG